MTEFFSLDEFKDWMDKEHASEEESHNKTLLGMVVESKLSAKKLLSKMVVEEGDADDLVEEFKEDGGTIIEVKGNRLLIETVTGSFYLSRHCVRKRSASDH